MFKFQAEYSNNHCDFCANQDDFKLESLKKFSLHKKRLTKVLRDLKKFSSIKSARKYSNYNGLLRSDDESKGYPIFSGKYSGISRAVYWIMHKHSIAEMNEYIKWINDNAFEAHINKTKIPFVNKSYKEIRFIALPTIPKQAILENSDSILNAFAEVLQRISEELSSKKTDHVDLARNDRLDRITKNFASLLFILKQKEKSFIADLLRYLHPDTQHQKSSGYFAQLPLLHDDKMFKHLHKVISFAKTNNPDNLNSFDECFNASPTNFFNHSELKNEVASHAKRLEVLEGNFSNIILAELPSTNSENKADIKALDAKLHNILFDLLDFLKTEKKEFELCKDTKYSSKYPRVKALLNGIKKANDEDVHEIYRLIKTGHDFTDKGNTEEVKKDYKLLCANLILPRSEISKSTIPLSLFNLLYYVLYEKDQKTSCYKERDSSEEVFFIRLKNYIVKCLKLQSYTINKDYGGYSKADLYDIFTSTTYKMEKKCKTIKEDLFDITFEEVNSIASSFNSMEKKRLIYDVYSFQTDTIKYETPLKKMIRNKLDFKEETAIVSVNACNIF